MNSSAAEVISLAEHRRAPQSTIDALMYSLRRGLLALTSRDPHQEETLRRLTQLTEEQLRDCCVLLKARKPPIGPAWSDGEIETLAQVWRKVRYNG